MCDQQVNYERTFEAFCKTSRDIRFQRWLGKEPFTKENNYHGLKKIYEIAFPAPCIPENSFDFSKMQKNKKHLYLAHMNLLNIFATFHPSDD